MEVSQEISKPKVFVFLSWCPDTWGGSENLWFESAMNLMSAGHAVSVIKTHVDYDHKRIKELIAAGASVDDYNSDHTLQIDKLLQFPIPKWLIPAEHLHRAKPGFDPNLYWVGDRLKSLKPDLVVVSQGENFDGIGLTYSCRVNNIPYILVSHKASDFLWAWDKSLSENRLGHLQAQRTYFVSNHNRRLTEQQLGIDLPNAELIRTPFATPVDEPLPWPDGERETIKFACVSRMYILDKGQDILFQVLAMDKWRQRPLEIDLYGAGVQLETLKALAVYLKLTNVNFVGFTSNVADIWRTHHALILPSRSEGLPMSVVEAMYCGRPSIVTRVGGNDEVVDDGVNGYIADSPSVVDLDEAMERAWNDRANWESIGREASRHVRTMYYPGAGEVFASKILQVTTTMTDEKKEGFEPGLVSVILPTYNRAQFLIEAVDSVRAQTYKNVQIIVVDDGSTDNTREVVAAMPDVQYVYQENQRQGAARNNGLAYARGEFLCSLDSDDIWKPEILEESLKALKMLDVDFVFSNSIGRNAEGKKFKSFFERYYRWRNFSNSVCPGWRLMEPSAVRAMYLDMCVSPSSALVFRRSAIGNHRWTTNMRIGDDWCFILDIVLNKPTRIAFTMKQHWIKRIIGDNICDDGDRVEFLQKLFIDDATLILNRFHDQLSVDERASMFGRLTYYHAAMSVLRLIRKQPIDVLKNGIHAIRNLVRTIRCSPDQFIIKVRPQ